jgi:hypothetical protein
VISASNAYVGGRDSEFGGQGKLVEGLQVYVDGSGKSGTCDISNMNLLVSVLKGEVDSVKKYTLELDEDSEYYHGKGQQN